TYRMEKGLTQTIKKIKTTAEKEKLITVMNHDIERLKAIEPFPDMYKYIGFYYEKPASLLDYLPKNGLVIIDEMSRIQETATSLDQEEAEWYSSLLASNEMIRDSHFSFDWHAVWQNIHVQRLYMSVFLRHIPNTQPQNIVNISSRDMQEFHGQMNLFQNELSRWEKGDFSVVILAPTEKRAEKIHSILMDYNIQSTISKKLQLPVKVPTIIVGNLNVGIELPMHKLAIITENELFKKRTKRLRRSKQKISNAERIKNYQELKVGDYVVHASHGIGKYLGIETVA